jgi:Flp pilus assembly pilin Flp
MESVAKMLVCTRETLARNIRGQAMTEYVMIVATIAVVVYGTYLALENNIASFASGADSVLTKNCPCAGGRPFLLNRA